MKIRKNGVWEDYKYPIYESATDTITSLPTDITADGQSVAAWTISGNMSQSGTPTPQNPIQPEEVGVLVTSGEQAGQYKIPISSANTTTPVYLGEVQSTRRIKKLVLDGTEGFIVYSDDTKTYRLIDAISTAPIAGFGISTHYARGTGSTTLEDESFYMTAQRRLYIRDTNCETLTAFTTFLQQQYAAGTPVTVWYVLAEPETGIVNEPLRKIGDYADTISNVAEIPTTAGEQTFDVDTSLKPSSVEITYKGWHKHTPKEYDNGSWS